MEEDEDWYREEYPFYHPINTTDGKEFEYVSDAPKDNQLDEYYDPKLIAYFVDQTQAEEAAKVAYCNKFRNLRCEIDQISKDTRNRSIDLNAWVKANNIQLDEELPEGWGDPNWQIERRVVMSLHRQKRFELLYSMWEQIGYRPLAFVNEYVIDRNCYLRLSNHDAATKQH